MLVIVTAKEKKKKTHITVFVRAFNSIKLTWRIKEFPVMPNHWFLHI